MLIRILEIAVPHVLAFGEHFVVIIIPKCMWYLLIFVVFYGFHQNVHEKFGLDFFQSINYQNEEIIFLEEYLL